jgi:hypothetical protein
MRIVVQILLGHSLIDRVDLCKLLWRAAALDLLGEVGEADDFRYGSRDLIY